MKNESKRRRPIRSLVASITIEDSSGRTTLYGPTEPAAPEPDEPEDPKECAKRRRVECGRCLRYGGAPGRYEASCPFKMGEEKKL